MTIVRAEKTSAVTAIPWGRRWLHALPHKTMRDRELGVSFVRGNPKVDRIDEPARLAAWISSTSP